MGGGKKLPRKKLISQKVQVLDKLNNYNYGNLTLAALAIVLAGVLFFNWVNPATAPGEITPTASTTNPTQPPEGKTHVVQEGESLSLISLKYYGTPFKYDELARANNITTPELISPGMVVKVPDMQVAGAQTNSITAGSYVVVTGDTLWDIAVRAYGDGYAWVKIAQANNLANPDLIHAGNVLTIPR